MPLVEISNRKILVLSVKTIAVSTSADFIEGSNISIDHLGIVAGAFDTLEFLSGDVLQMICPDHMSIGDTIRSFIEYHERALSEPVA